MHSILSLFQQGKPPWPRWVGGGQSEPLACGRQTRRCGVVRRQGCNVRFLPLDIGDASSIAQFVTTLKGEYGGLDILVNNAAIAFKVRQAGSLPPGYQAGWFCGAGRRFRPPHPSPLPSTQGGGVQDPPLETQNFFSPVLALYRGEHPGGVGPPGEVKGVPTHSPDPLNTLPPPQPLPAKTPPRLPPAARRPHPVLPPSLPRRAGPPGRPAPAEAAPSRHGPPSPSTCSAPRSSPTPWRRCCAMGGRQGCMDGVARFRQFAWIGGSYPPGCAQSPYGGGIFFLLRERLHQP